MRTDAAEEGEGCVGPDAEQVEAVLAVVDGAAFGVDLFVCKEDVGGEACYGEVRDYGIWLDEDVAVDYVADFAWEAEEGEAGWHSADEGI